MKHLNKNLAFCLLGICIVLSACSKKSNPTPPSTNNFGGLNATWETTTWGGIANDDLSFVISSSGTDGVVSAVGSPSYNFAVGDKIFTNLVKNANGTFSGMGKYTYGVNSVNSATRAANITLQNNNTQITVDYPEIDSDFPEVIYVYQKQ